MDVGKRLDVDGPAANGKEMEAAAAGEGEERRVLLKTPDR